MKTLYSTLGRAALKRLRETAANAYTIQKELLIGLMQQNADTEYGRNYDFAHISSVREYQDQVPVTNYGNYDDYIERMMAGEEKLLTEIPPCLLQHQFRQYGRIQIRSGFRRGYGVPLPICLWSHFWDGRGVLP